jgi:transcriptional regulator with XRE-family HTH domain
MAGHKTTEEQAIVMMRLASTIRMLRESENMSIRDFAEKLDINHSDLFRLENGTTRNPSLFMIRKIAKTFDLTVDELMNFDAITCPTCGGRGWIKGDSNG